MTKENTAEEQGKEPVLKTTLAGDYYSATLTVDPGEKPEKVTHNFILDALKEKNITVGIDLDVVSSIADNPANVKTVVIAKGKPHQNGRDGEIKYLVDIHHEAKPKMLEDGTVDFKDMDAFLTVRVGDVLAERINPTEGTDGLTVTGKVIKAKPGKIANFKFGKNVQVSEDGMSIIAEKNGTIKMDGVKISIIEVLEIKGDVGVRTGNVQFKGKILVTGNVLTGYEIDCDGDLEIQGVVEGAHLKCTGDIIVGFGIQGRDEAVVDCQGNLMSRFINNCSANVKGNIEADAIMHSKIICDGEIKVSGKKGLLVGGEIKAKEQITAKVIGSDMGTQTKITLGVDSELIERYQFLADKIKELRESTKKLDQAINMINRQMKAAPGNAQLKGMLNKTKLSKIEYHNELTGFATELKELQERINTLQGSKVIASEVYPGTKITIGHSHYNVKNLLKDAEICKYEGEITTVRR